MTLSSPLLRAASAINRAGYFLITSSIMYFIVGATARLLHQNMLDWTVCGTVFGLFHAEFCGFAPHVGGEGLDFFLHRLVTAPIPWFLLIGGFVLLGLSLPLLKIMRYTPQHRNNQD